MTRYVRTEAGAKRYKLPIGSPIGKGGGAVAKLSGEAGAAAKRLSGASPSPKKATPAKAAKANPSPRSTEDRIRSAYSDIAKKGSTSDFVGLADLRDHPELAGVPRADVDQALKQMERQSRGEDHGPAGPAVRIIPVANSKSLKQRDRDAALRIGVEDNHAIRIRQAAAKPETSTPAPKKRATAADVMKRAGAAQVGSAVTQRHVDHLEGLAAEVKAGNGASARDDADKYLAGVKGRELDALASHYHQRGRTVADKRRNIRELVVGRLADSKAIQRVGSGKATAASGSTRGALSRIESGGVRDASEADLRAALIEPDLSSTMRAEINAELRRRDSASAINSRPSSGRAAAALSRR